MQEHLALDLDRKFEGNFSSKANCSDIHVVLKGVRATLFAVLNVVTCLEVCKQYGG